MWILSSETKYLLNIDNLTRISYHGNETDGYTIYAHDKTGDPYELNHVMEESEARRILYEIFVRLGDDSYSTM